MGAQSSVQLPDTNVEQRGVADPSQIGQEKQNRGAVRRQSKHHERDDGQPDHQADDHREANLMRAEHGERPRAVEHELHNPRRERRAHTHSAPDQPSRYGDEHIEHCPNWPEHPCGRRPGRLLQRRIPLPRLEPRAERADQRDGGEEGEEGEEPHCPEVLQSTRADPHRFSQVDCQSRTIFIAKTST